MLPLDPSVFVPAPAQGALAYQCRRSDARVRDALAPLDDERTRAAVHAERTLLARLEGGCELAFGAWCTNPDGGEDATMVAMVERDGEVLSAAARGAEAAELADELWTVLGGARGDGVAAVPG